ncbi:MAG: hypothetical protein ACRDYX_21730 [Egibacteraceae bacterium]
MSRGLAAIEQREVQGQAISSGGRERWISECDRYLAERSGRYEWRRTRYRKAAGHLHERGLDDSDTLVDVAAGWTEFDYCLRHELDWRGRYIPIDGGIDGTDLSSWVPARFAEWFVALEILEHLTNPARLVQVMQAHADKGLVISTPNPAVVDVMAMDPTHLTPLPAETLARWGLHVEICSLYGQIDDGLLGWWDTP